MQGEKVVFKNAIDDKGTPHNVTVDNCLIGPTRTATAPRPQIMIHPPKEFTESVAGGFVEYCDDTYHCINKTSLGSTAPLMPKNTPTKWNRYVIAERLY